MHPPVIDSFSHLLCLFSEIFIGLQRIIISNFLGQGITQTSYHGFDTQLQKPVET